MRDNRISMSKLSKATGIPVSTLSEWSAGRIPRLSKQVLELSKFLGVSIEYLITGTNKHNTNNIYDLTDRQRTVLQVGKHVLIVERLENNERESK
jgi:transcriptional regulator with XRE-family HTH domain